MAILHNCIEGVDDLLTGHESEIETPLQSPSATQPQEGLGPVQEPENAKKEPEQPTEKKKRQKKKKKLLK